jgi:hypothetical protein
MSNNLTFLDLCKESFGRLFSRFNFSVVESRQLYVRYESRNTYVKVSYDDREGEIFVDIGELINGKYTFELDSKHEFSLNELLAEVNPKKVYKSRIFRDPKEIGIELLRLSKILEEEGKDVLNGKPKIFSKLLKNRLKIQEMQERIDHVTDIKEKAKLAFEKRDYKSALSLYKTIESELDLTEKKRYEIASKRVR